MKMLRELIKKLCPSAAKEYYKRVRSQTITFLFRVFKRFPLHKKRVVFCNVWGFGDNPKWVAKALRSYDRSIEIIFITNSLEYEGVIKGIKFVLTNSVRAIYYLSTAHVWVDCNRKEPYISKREGQYYIQTWHGSLPLKKLEADCPDTLSKAYLENARRDSAMADLFLSDSEFANEIYRRAFMYDGEIAITGSPRLDPLIKPNLDRVELFKKRIEKQCALIEGRKPDLKRVRERKIAVFAPTYRAGESDYIPTGFNDLEGVLGALEKRFGGSFVLITRLHPLVAKKNHRRRDSRIIDGNAFPDLYAILEAADVLITDYSNTLFEFSYTGKPVFLFAPDYKEYEGTRGMYFDYASLPYPHALSEQELKEEILAYEPEEYCNARQKFFTELGIREDGHASRRVAQRIAKIVYHG